MHTIIDYANDLNPAQYEAATTIHGPVLVIAGAGSGKTRTIVYRLAYMIESGIPASSILLLTFTRKAAQEMLERARQLLQNRGMPDLAAYTAATNPYDTTQALHTGLSAVQGGTFHAYAYSILRIFQPEGYQNNLTVMDSHDILAALQHCREALKAGKGDRSFPKNQTVNGLLSKSRNKEVPLETVIRMEAQHLLPHAGTIEAIGRAYAEFKREKGLLDYDDLLFTLEDVLRSRPEALEYCRRRHQYIMIDEYQDTNPVQARLAGLIAGYNTADGQSMPETPGNIMVVGDDAQSIYAFRGADVRNILRFPDLFPGTKLIRLEENYRSTQPILDLTNAILANAAEGFTKHLFTRREGSITPNIIRPLSDRSQANLVTSRIIEFLRSYPPHEIAVLFRAGFHSYSLELQLNKLGIRFKKYGGIKYAEAAHVKDVMSFIRLILNPLDFTAFSRMAELNKGVGAKTCLKIYQLILAGDADALAKTVSKYSELAADLEFIDFHRKAEASPAALLTAAIAHYQPRLELLYPDDHPRRLQGLEQLIQIAAAYTDLDLFIADLSLDEPLQDDEKEDDAITLSTIHSAKGLEWTAVLILDLVEERFPSRHALARPEDFEEERRLMYVACTRAKKHLELFIPATLYDKGTGGNIATVPSPFVRELAPSLYTEWQESYTGALVEKERYDAPHRSHTSMTSPRQPRALKPCPPVEVSHTAPCSFSHNEREDTIPRRENTIGTASSPAIRPEQCGFCTHKIFGRGKIIQHIPPDKYRVNFPGIGLKVIMAAYLTMES